MQTMSMTQYLTEIKKIVDQIASAGSSVDPEEVIIYILNGLPQAYQSFTTTIRTMQESLSLDTLYALLISEEIHLKAAALKFPKMSDNQSALYSIRGRGQRGRGRPPPNNAPVQNNNSSSAITCQICKKKGQSADACWHRLNPNYTPNQSSAKNNSALVANNDSTSIADWYIDSGASSHMTNNTENLEFYNTYNGNDTVTLEDGRSIPIAHTGSRILPTPASKLILSKLLHIPSLSYNLLSISNLVKDNHISITFDKNGFVFKDRKTNQVILDGPCSKGLYKVASKVKCKPVTSLRGTSTSSVNWHLRLGHPHQRVLEHISNSNPVLRILLFKSVCISCTSCKGQKLVLE
ncbi:Retrovirus-related Pol polyprotein from transposon TNT 1-94 [Dendrobium catenatum]|uniref:Retrovirus-related Pol polyprotein from transposon TNT 1-94 n=1 Tax=Dendrobium catenatum TaxID=906689 RepID=A0A2I0V9G5_9ASPA|nr:Retrovirus-related Pol polyprotein from transposon TNT 1-94 [Dendrobium catenatum]